jgi:hydrolase, P-loop family
MQNTVDVVEIRSEAEADLEVAVKEFLQKVSRLNCICFWGGLGAGKTTFIRALCKYLGVVDVVTSPTFSIINEYHCSDGAIIYHFDFYRLNSLREAEDIGVEDYFANSEGLCLIEWPAIVEPILPAHLLDVAIVAQSDGRRFLKIGARE